MDFYDNDFFYFPDVIARREELAAKGIVGILREKPIWGIWHPATRTGDTGIGKTWEDVFGMVENNRKDADYHGNEFKAVVETSDAFVTLFTQRPCGPHIKWRDDLCSRFGLQDGLKRRLHTNLAVNRLSEVNIHQMTLRLTDEHLQLLTVADDQHVEQAFWRSEMLRTRFTEKVGDTLILVTTERRATAEGEEFRFTGFNIYTETDFAAFVELIKAGIISLHIRLSGDATKVLKDRGTGFRIAKSKISQLYRKTANYVLC